MSSLADLSALNPITSGSITIKSTNKGAGSSDMSMDDFLQVMVAQFQNQDPENAASTSDMLNQLVQMTVVQAISTITDATTLMYSASLVGKEVTIGVYDKHGLQEIVGTVTGTGTYGGQPVVFVDGVSYYLSDIMAVGRLPETEAPTTPVESEEPDPPSGEGDNSGAEDDTDPVEP